MENNELDKEVIATEEQAVDALLDGKVDEVVEYLKTHKTSDNPDDGNPIVMFCYTVFERFQPGDKSGLVHLAKVMEKLL